MWIGKPFSLSGNNWKVRKKLDRKSDYKKIDSCCSVWKWIIDEDGTIIKKKT